MQRTIQRIRPSAFAAICVLLTAVLGAAVLFAQSPQSKEHPLNTTALTIAGRTYNAALANTHSSRIQGLLGWNAISDDLGMLLDFIVEEKYAIHMQGMKFPIDAIWIDAKGVITLIYEDIQPNSGLNYLSILPARYCLETKAGFVARHGIKSGMTVTFGPSEKPR